MDPKIIAGVFSVDGFFFTQDLGDYKCFTIGISKNARSKGLLTEMQNSLGVGRVSPKPPASFQWRIARSGDIKVFAELIGPYLVGVARDKFQVFYIGFLNYKKRKKFLDTPYKV